MCVDFIEPVREFTIGSAEDCLVVVYGLLVVLVVIGRGQPRQVSEVRQGMLAATLARVDCCHRAGLVHSRSLISQCDDIEGSRLEVQ